MKHTPAIVTIAYNRPDSLARLLSSIDRANYPEGVKVPLVISIDKSDTDEVVKVAKDFVWEHGEKLVIERNPRMGLKAHVLTCGDLTAEYGSIIVLEDDLYVSPAFYEYSVKALDFADGDDRIGSISLYNHLFNVHARKSFVAIDDGYDNWYFQMSSSWGQAYSKAQWEGFKAWYELHKEDDLHRPEVPANISGWSDKSWLKFYIYYLIDTGRYALYPRISYTTNFGDVGSHAVKADADLQVPICGAKGSLYLSFSSLEQSNAVYDAYFENARVRSTISEEGQLLVDLYGLKPLADLIKSGAKASEETINDGKESAEDIRFILSSQLLPYKVVRSYGRQMRPVDANIFYQVSGNDFYLYDISESGPVPVKGEEAVEYLYEYRGISAKQMLEMIKYRISEKLSRK